VSRLKTPIKMPMSYPEWVELMRRYDRGQIRNIDDQPANLKDIAEALGVTPAELSIRFKSMREAEAHRPEEPQQDMKEFRKAVEEVLAKLEKGEQKRVREYLNYQQLQIKGLETNLRGVREVVNIIVANLQTIQTSLDNITRELVRAGVLKPKGGEQVGRINR